MDHMIVIAAIAHAANRKETGTRSTSLGENRWSHGNIEASPTATSYHKVSKKVTGRTIGTSFQDVEVLTAVSFVMRTSNCHTPIIHRTIFSEREFFEKQKLTASIGHWSFNVIERVVFVGTTDGSTAAFGDLVIKYEDVACWNVGIVHYEVYSGQGKYYW